jgi:hypothetical protein
MATTHGKAPKMNQVYNHPLFVQFTWELSRMSILVPTASAVVRTPRSFRPAVGSVVVFMLLGFLASANLPARGDELPGKVGASFSFADDKPSQEKVKSGGKLTDDPLPEKIPEGWQEYVQEKYKAYSIWHPKKRRKLLQTEGSIDLKSSEFKNAKLGYVILRCDIDDNIKLNVQRLIFPLMKGEMIDAQKAIEVFRDMHMEDHPGTITEEYDLMLGKMPGKEFRVDLKNDEKSRLRIYQTGRAVWRIWVTGTKEQVMGDTTNLIFSSFKNQILIKDKKP